jgi:hypothetical protein
MIRGDIPKVNKVSVSWDRRQPPPVRAEDAGGVLAEIIPEDP